jgi:hypothetical protein
MRPVLLIGINFVRTQWLVVALMLTWVVGITGFFAWHSNRSEVLFFFRQQSFYALGAATLVGLPAIHNERRSRRILAVLAKGLHRWQYLAGLLCGCGMIAAIFCGAVAVSTAWLCRQAGIQYSEVLPLMLALFLGCIAASSAGVFWSVILHPLPAMVATMATLLVPFSFDLRAEQFSLLFPVAAISQFIWDFNFENPAHGLGQTGAAAAIHGLIFWVAAAVIFTRQDVTIAPE